MLLWRKAAIIWRKPESTTGPENLLPYPKYGETAPSSALLAVAFRSMWPGAGPLGAKSLPVADG